MDMHQRRSYYHTLDEGRFALKGKNFGLKSEESLGFSYPALEFVSQTYINCSFISSGKASMVVNYFWKNGLTTGSNSKVDFSI